MSRCLFVLGTILMGCFSSCNKKNEPKQTPSAQLRLNLRGEPTTMDPRKGGDLISSAMHFLLFEGLTRLNPDGVATLAGAESISVSEDRKTYIFHLRNCRWSNGTPVTAYDYEKSWKDILNPHFPSVNAHLLYPIKNAELAKKGEAPPASIGIKAENANTLVVSLEKPTPYFLELISFCVFYPVSQKIDESSPEWASHASEQFTSNGPFLLAQWKHNDEILLKKNPAYWNQKEILLESIHYSMVDNETTALQMYENGELDLLGDPLSPLPLDSLPDLSKRGLLQARQVAATTLCAFNTEKPPFNNCNIRKAFCYAIDREAIIKNITQLGEAPALGPIPPVLKSRKDAQFFIDANVVKAQEHLQKGLQELGLNASDLTGVVYHYTSSDTHHKIAQALQQQWLKALGIQVSLENLEHKVLMNRLYKRDFSFAQTVWIAQYNDPMSILERFKLKGNVKNYPGWEDPQYIQLLEQSSLDAIPEERALTLERAEALFMEHMPVAPIFHSSSAFLIKPYVKNFGIARIGNGFFEKIYIDTQLKSAR